MSPLVAGLIGALLASLLIGGYAVWCGWRPLRKPPVIRRAQLFNVAGQLDSVRTIEGPPPNAITCRAGVYRIDPTTRGDHLVYRRQP